MTDDEIYELFGQTFEWDGAKARRNWFHHRVYFTEAATVFFDKDVVYFRDEDHSIEEERYIVVGHSARSRVIYVVHVTRGRESALSARGL